MRYMLHTMLAATVAVALVAAPAQASAKRSQKKAAPAHSMTGCLSKGTEANTYVLANSEAKGPKTAEIVSSSVDLAPHVGHKVTITGTTVSTKTAAKAEAKAEGKKKASKSEMKEEAGEHHMKVTGLKMVASSC
jgi:hypothetical protein